MFPSFEEIHSQLVTVAKENPEFVQLFSLGQSVKGREIWALKISANPMVEEIEPEIRIMGAIHGDECLSVNTVLSIMDWLVDGYGFDPLASDLVDGSEIVLIPLVNPDGYTAATSTRTNANGVDLNRNFGFGWFGGGDKPFSENETRAIRNHAQNNPAALSLSYHTVAPYINLPWNYTPQRPLEVALLQHIGAAYQGNSPYSVVVGWDWYNTNGDSNDWALGTQGTLDVTLELISDTDPQWNVHGPGVGHFLASVFTRMEGVVVDSKTNEPLLARIHLGDLNDPQAMPIFTDPIHGDYHRLVLPGSAVDLTAVANGYKPQTITNITVAEGSVTPVDFSLEKETGDADANYVFAVNQMTLPQEISTWLGIEWYENNTLPYSVLGKPDGKFYSLSPGGSITLDMGKHSAVVDGEGPDFTVHSGTDSLDSIDIFVSNHPDQPFVQVLSNGVGTLTVDLADLDQPDMTSVRFIKIIDTSTGVFNTAYAGYDLDAISSHHTGPAVDGGVEADGGTNETTHSGCQCGLFYRSQSKGVFNFLI